MRYVVWVFPFAAVAACVAIVSGVLGLVDLTATSIWIAEALFVAFLVLFAIWLVLGDRPVLTPTETSLPPSEWEEARKRCAGDVHDHDGVGRDPTGN